MRIYKVVVSTLAKTDLQNIVTYISDIESMAQAKYVEHGILSEMKHLECFPFAYPRDEYASTNNVEVRFIMKWRYKILFFIDANTVQIVGIFHTAQNPNKLRRFSIN
ncbi:MAG: type II toxin-antitoxin system RelE/ParE family toxin [Bacteroidales bacterium]|nr:type II toxin-antitoxin system RelE/ParE family toxin [Bacteroidales bacterium]